MMIWIYLLELPDSSVMEVMEDTMACEILLTALARRVFYAYAWGLAILEVGGM
jgi:hypothetical protein